MKTFLTVIIFLISTLTHAQLGIVPFSGIVYFKQGISAKKISTELDGSTWTGKYLPQGGELKVILEEPNGFSTGPNGNCHPDADMIILNAKGDTLGKMVHMFAKQTDGVPADYLKSLKMSVGFDERATPGDVYTIYISFYDAVPNHTSRIDLHFPATVTRKGAQPIPTTSSTYSSTSSDGYNIISNTDINLSKVEIYIDSSLKPDNISFSIRLVGLKNITPAEIDKGKTTFYLYNHQLLPIYDETHPVPGDDFEPRKIAVAISANPPMVNVLYKYTLSTKGKTLPASWVRFRWVSADGKKIIEGVSPVL